MRFGIFGPKFADFRMEWNLAADQTISSFVL